MNNYKFDPDVMRELDEQRIEIVHGAAFGRPLKAFQPTGESLWYLQQTTMYFSGLVNRKYGLQIDPAYLGTLFVST